VPREKGQIKRTFAGQTPDVEMARPDKTEATNYLSLLIVVNQLIGKIAT
jgi:hypothetical protein